MSKNGPLMYRVKPLYDSCPNIILPTCMYKMNSIYGNHNTCDLNTVNHDVDQDVQQLIDLENHQLSIIQKLEELKAKVLQMKEEFDVETKKHISPITEHQDIVIKANPYKPPLSVWIFHQLFSQSTPTRLATYLHSSLKALPDNINKLPVFVLDEKCNISFTIIWKEALNDHEMIINPIHQGPIEGEVNIARYISRLTSFNYDIDPILSTQIDDWLEIAHSSIIYGNNKERQCALKSLNSHLGKNSYLVGNSLSVADIVMWSVLIQAQLHLNLSANTATWFKSLSDNELFLNCNKYISM